MDPRQRWQALQSHLHDARRAFENGDRAAALSHADAALALDPDFLAAHTLRERIVASAEVRVEPDLAGNTLIHRGPDGPIDASSAPSLVSAEGWIRFEQRARQRRIERRLQAARSAIVRSRLVEARQAIAEAREIDPDHPDLISVGMELDAAEHDRALRRANGPWLTAAAVFVLFVLGASMLDDRRELASYPTAGSAPLIGAAEPPAIGVDAVSLGPVDTASAGDDSMDARLGEPVGMSGADSREQQAQLEPPPSEPTAAAAPAPAPAPATTTLLPPTPVPSPAPDTRLAGRSNAGADAASRAAAPGDTAAAISLASSPPPAAAESPSAVRAVDREPLDVPSRPEPAAVPSAGAANAAIASGSAGAAPAAPGPANAVAAAGSGNFVTGGTTGSVGNAGSVASNIPRDDQLVRQTLQRYRSAYDDLDVGQAQAVWPAVDQSALARAFNGLASQNLTFDNCDVEVNGTAARALCRGSMRYVPKVGSPEPRVEARVWSFTLRKAGDGWQIETARAER